MSSLVALLLSVAFADTSTSALNLTFVVPVIQLVGVTKIDTNNFQVSETSNSPDGYIVRLTTDVTSGIIYNNLPIIGDVLTNSPDPANNLLKTLKFITTPSIVTITMEAR